MARLLPHFKLDVRQVTLIPSRGGCFELKVGDQLIYSKLETGTFPDEGALIRDIERALGWSPPKL